MEEEEFDGYNFNGHYLGEKRKGKAISNSIRAFRIYHSVRRELKRREGTATKTKINP